MTGVIVHEWLELSGGAENVVEAMRSAFPEAELWCAWNDAKQRFPDAHETVLARTPLRRSKALSLLAMPVLWRHLPEVRADWALVSSHLFAHHVRFGGRSRGIPKLVYAHTPARYIWVPELDRRGASLPVRAVTSLMKGPDRRRAQEPVAVAANSRFVADRISMAWNRDSTVIYPPVSLEKFRYDPPLAPDERETMSRIPEGFLLAVSRWVPYKKLDAAIAAGVAADLPVVIAGKGPDGPRLRSMAAEHPGRVVFVDAPSDSLLRALYAAAAAVVFAPIEDFGIVPVEAMASGTPVLVNREGGASESVLDGVTGVHVDSWESSEELRDAVWRATSIDAKACRERAAEFDEPVFEQRIKRFVADGLRGA